MISNQIYNFFYYGAIMSLETKLVNISPDYIKEKTLLFFNKLGKNEFIKYPGSNNDFWVAYTDIWNIEQDDYELMNIINFILSFKEIIVSVFPDNYPMLDTGEMKHHKIFPLIFNSFEKYIGHIEEINKSDLSWAIHVNLLKYIKKYIDFNDRYFKLLCLNNI